MKGKSLDLTRGDKGFSVAASGNTPLGKASREALEGAVAAIVAGMKKVPWSGRVSDVREGQVYINAGAEMGITPGMEFDIYEQQAALIDPESGRSLGAPDRRIGSVTVDAVQDKYAVARVKDGQGFKRDNLVRFKAQ